MNPSPLEIKLEEMAGDAIERFLECTCAEPDLGQCSWHMEDYERMTAIYKAGFRDALELKEVGVLIIAAARLLHRMPDDVHFEDCAYIDDEELDCSCGMHSLESDLSEALTNWNKFKGIYENNRTDF